MPNGDFQKAMAAWEACKHLALARGSIEREMELVAERESDYWDRMMEEYPDVEEECSELADMYGDLWDNIGEFLKSFGAASFGNLIEIAQCASALGTLNNYLDRVQVLQDELDRLRDQLDDAERELDECLHRLSK